ncbi:hypothetical protein BC828DRAFT_378652 [Blastocladiella britannica]|nr:hypothetical protein BC828DRAFT_378652 [Blastocladiella britannica]
MSASPRISVAIDDSSELGDMVAEMTLSAAASHPGSRTAAGTAAAGGARRSRNSLMYAATAPAALLQLERSITPMTADVAESGAVAMAVEADPLVASAHADAEYARVARAQNRVSHGYFGMYEPEALSYMQFVETSGLDRVATPVMTAGIRAANAAAATGGSLPRQVMFADGTLDGIPARSHLGSLSRNRSDSSASNSPGSGFLHRSGSTASDATERAMMGGPATSMAPVRGTSSRATKRESLYMAGSAPAPVSTAGLPSSATAIGSLTAASMMAAYGSSPTVSSSVGVLGAGSPISTPTGSPMGAVSPLAVAMATVGGAALPAGAASLSSRAVYTAEQNLQALLRTDKDSLSRELANMDPQQLAQLQALLRERSAAQTTSSQAGVSSSRPAAGY